MTPALLAHFYLGLSWDDAQDVPVFQSTDPDDYAMSLIQGRPPIVIVGPRYGSPEAA